MDLGYFTSVRAVVPEALNGFVSQSQWDGICSTFRSVDDDATFKACLGEWACCCLTGCFCVFFGHSAFHSYFVKDRLQGLVNNVNHSHFQGSPVLGVGPTGDHIFFHHERLPAPRAPMVVQQIYAVPAQAAPPAYGAVGSPIMQQQAQYMPPPMAKGEVAPVAVAYAAPVEVQPQRTAQFVVQGHPPPGSQVQIQAPNGAMVVLALPPDATDGSIITYAY